MATTIKDKYKMFMIKCKNSGNKINVSLTELSLSVIDFHYKFKMIIRHAVTIVSEMWAYSLINIW